MKNSTDVHQALERAFSRIQSGSREVVPGTEPNILEIVEKVQGYEIYAKLQRVRTGYGTTLVALYTSKKIAFEKGIAGAFVVFACREKEFGNEHDAQILIIEYLSNTFKPRGNIFQSMTYFQKTLMEVT